MNSLLLELVPFVRNGEVTLKTTMGLVRGVVENLVVYSKAGDFYIKFASYSASPTGLQSSELELPCWEVIGVENPYE